MSNVLEIYPTDEVSIRKMGLRDGLELVKSWQYTRQKQEWIKAENNSDLIHLETGSYMLVKHFQHLVDINDLIEIVSGLGGLVGFPFMLGATGDVVNADLSYLQERTDCVMGI